MDAINFPLFISSLTIVGVWEGWEIIGGWIYSFLLDILISSSGFSSLLTFSITFNFISDFSGSFSSISFWPLLRFFLFLWVLSLDSSLIWSSSTFFSSSLIIFSDLRTVSPAGSSIFIVCALSSCFSSNFSGSFSSWLFLFFLLFFLFFWFLSFPSSLIGFSSLFVWADSSTGFTSFSLLLIVSDIFTFSSIGLISLDFSFSSSFSNYYYWKNYCN